MLQIPAESKKGNTHRLLPMAPEFDEVPVDRRRGRVFVLPCGPSCPTSFTFGLRVSQVGEAARVVVNQRRRGKDGKAETVKKFACAHYLRRSFGFRWPRLVMPPVLKELMRHSKIDTTMKYYVGLNAEATADELWRVAGKQLGKHAVPASA